MTSSLIKEPALIKPKIGNYEKNVFKECLTSGRSVWGFGFKGKLNNYTTTETVGDGVGMILSNK
jgi:hypothetical protein